MARPPRFDAGARPGPARLGRSERTMLRGFAAVVVAAGTALALSTVVRITESLTASRLTLPFSASFAVPPESVSGTATLVSGTFDHAMLTVENVDTGSRLLLAGATLSSGLAQIVIAALLAFVLLRLGQAGTARPFGRRVTWLLATASVVLIVGGLLSFGLATAAQFLLVAQLDPDPNGSTFPFTSGPADFTIVIIGLVLGVVAAIFEIGERMQRDTDGLV